MENFLKTMMLYMGKEVLNYF